MADQPKFPICCECDRPGTMHINNIPFCSQHWRETMRVLQQQSADARALANMAHRVMNMQLGMVGPDLFPEPRPMPIHHHNHLHPGAVVSNTVTIHGDNHGAIAQGIIESLTQNLTILKQEGQTQIADAIEEMLGAVVQDRNEGNIDNDQAGTAAESLRFLAEEAQKDEGKFRKGIVRGYLSTLTEVLASSYYALNLWKTAETAVRAYFGV